MAGSQDDIILLEASKIQNSDIALKWMIEMKKLVTLALNSTYTIEISTTIESHYNS